MHGYVDLDGYLELGRESVIFFGLLSSSDRKVAWLVLNNPQGCLCKNKANSNKDSQSQQVNVSCSFVGAFSSFSYKGQNTR